MGSSRSTRKAMKENADAQVKATKEASDQQLRASVDAARAAADQQQLLVSRQKAEEAVAATLESPLASAEVAIESPTQESASATTRKRKAQYGQGGYSSGVNI